MFYPMLTMVALTAVVGFYLLSLRARAIKRREASIRYFRLNTGEGAPPARVQAAANHFSNLFEVPLLFYITCLLLMQTGLQGPLLQALAWVFVASRLVHAWIHLTYNNVFHRMLAFVTGFVSLLAMWVIMAWHFS